MELYKQYQSGGYSPIMIKKCQQDIIGNFGFNADLVGYVLACICYGFGWPSEPIFDVKGVSFTMILVEGGTFIMGALPEPVVGCLDEEVDTVQVTLDSFQIGQAPVTQELWQAVMGSNPSYFKDDSYPVENVSWNDCQEFIKKLNRLTGKKFRLPTEAEWEFAARGGNKSKGYVFAGSNFLSDVGWYSKNAEGSTHRVCTKAPNELGIYDMSGNVEEWCQDWYGDYSAVPCRNPQGPPDGSLRVHRGGDGRDDASGCRVSSRYCDNPECRFSRLGLRLAL